jgi:hypothetical protein
MATANAPKHQVKAFSVGMMPFPAFAFAPSLMTLMLPKIQAAAPKKGEVKAAA